MCSAQTLQFLAGIIGLIGGVILAYSLNNLISEINLALNMLSTSIESIARGGDIYLFQGQGKRLEAAGAKSNCMVKAGILCLIVSVLLTSISLIVH